MTLIRCYIASKLKHAAAWRALRENWKRDGIDLHARWFDQSMQEEAATPADFGIFWLCDQEDVASAAVVVVYGEKGEELRGALVEAGIAIACGNLVIVVGDSPSFGTWQHHPAVLRAQTIEHAKRMILNRFGSTKE